MVIERTYNIPLRREWLKVPKYKRAKKAVIAVKQFLAKHMHQEDLSKIKLGKHINLYTWENGIKNPPHHIKVNVKKTDDEVVYAELFGYELKIPEEKETKKAEKKEVKKETKKTEETEKEKKESTNEEKTNDEKETEKEKKTVKKEESKTNEAENKELEKTVENLEIKKPEQNKE